MISSLRAQLTLWSVGLMALVLVALSVSAYFGAEQLLYRRMDASLLLTVGDTARALAQAAGVAQTEHDLAAHALDLLRYPNRTIWVLDSEGRVLAEKKASVGPQVRMPDRVSEAGGTPRWVALDESRRDADDACRSAWQRITNSATGKSYIVVVAQSTETISDDLDMLRDLAFLGVPFAAILAGIGGWLLARRALAPVAAMAASAQQITARNLEERLPVRNPRDEVGSLAVTFNQLLDRLSAAFTQQRQFMADASHELRSPLSVMRTAADVTLGKGQRDESDYREALTIVKQQAGRLSQIVDDMFALARADMGQLTLHPVDLYLDEIVNDAVRAAAVLARNKEIKIESRITDETAYRGDEGLLRQMVLNLLDNAVKYTPRGGSVTVSLEPSAANLIIRVTDTGPGIAIQDQPLIFDRFFRSDQARTGNDGTQGGAGLGLPIARSIAELHGGKLRLERSDSAGSTFVVVLPRA